MPVTTDVILYILLGALAGIVYALRRVFILERKIDRIDRRIAAKVGANKPKKK
tara:strand:+ start:735 stop:893 length:159 start_codon:yes stop_codon:yes gene_type:complete